MFVVRAKVLHCNYFTSQVVECIATVLKIVSVYDFKPFEVVSA